MPNEFRGREPAKESHGEVVGAAIVGSKLLCEVVECVKAVAGIKAFLTLPAVALHLSVVARGVRPRKSILREHPKDHIRIKQTIKHKFGEGSFGSGLGFVLLDHSQGKFAQQIQVFLNGFVGNAQIIFFKVNIQQPVHGFHGPFHPGMVKQALRRKRSAGNIIMPL